MDVNAACQSAPQGGRAERLARTPGGPVFGSNLQAIGQRPQPAPKRWQAGRPGTALVYLHQAGQGQSETSHAGLMTRAA